VKSCRAADRERRPARTRPGRASGSAALTPSPATAVPSPPSRRGTCLPNARAWCPQI
jgi:hypothetical protein